MRQIVMLVVAPLALSIGCRSREARPTVTYRAPPSFSIEAAASPFLLGPVSTFTFDSRGRPVVVKAHGYATLLLDQNRDGFFDTEKTLTTTVRQVRGLWFDGRVLYLIGNNDAGQYGLYRLEDGNGDDAMDSAEYLTALPDTPEGSYDMRRAPDGSLTLAHGGKLLRWREELQTIAGGFVNARAVAYDSDGEAFVLDSGRGGAPRLVHAVPGGVYGVPEYQFDMLPSLAETASIKAIEFYEHAVYPAAFHGALFAAEGPPGRITARRMVRNGATYRVGELAAEFASSLALDVAAIQVGPDGFVYFAGAQGLHRIRYTPSWPERWSKWRETGAGGAEIVRQPQPLSSWGHAALFRQHELLEAHWGDELDALALRSSASVEDRVRAILLLHRLGPKPKPALLKTLASSVEPRVRAAAISAGGVDAAGLRDNDPFVRRRAAEAIDGSVDEALYPLLADSDRFVRHAARRALERAPRETWKTRVLFETNPRAAFEGMLALAETAAGREEEQVAVIEKLMPFLADPKLRAADRLDAMRLFVVASAEVKDADLRQRSALVLLSQFEPSAGNEALMRQTAAALAWCGGSAAVERILEAMPTASRPLQVYYAQCLRSVHDGWTAAHKGAMLQWFGAAANWQGGGANFTRSLSQLFDSFAGNVLTATEARQARRRFPLLAGVASGLPTAEEIYELQTAETRPTATAGKGKEIFEKRCVACHVPAGSYGPDLLDVSERLDRAALLEAILWPARAVAEPYRSEAIELADGSSLEALVTREDDKVLVLRTSNEPRPITILKRRVRGRRKLDKSIMPEGLLEGYDQGAVAGLLEFLEGDGERN